jgi:hypothetical protein
MTSLYTTLAQNGAVGRNLLHCNQCEKPFTMSSCKLDRPKNSTTTEGYTDKYDTSVVWDDRNIPHRFICPINLSIMVDPVIASDGVTYEYQSLVRHAAAATDAANLVSPMTRKKLNTTVYENLVLRGEIYEFVQRHGGKLETKPIIPGFRDISRGLKSLSLDRADRVSHYAVSDTTMDGTFYWACTAISTPTQPYQNVFIKGFGPSDTTSLQFSIPFASETSRISSMEWCIGWRDEEDTMDLYITVSSKDLQDGGLWVYDCSGNRIGRKSDRQQITSSAIVQHDDGSLQHILQYQPIQVDYQRIGQMYTLDESFNDTEFHIVANSSVRSDIIQIGVVGLDIVALLESRVVLKYINLSHLKGFYGDFNTTREIELVPKPLDDWTHLFMVTGSGMFAVFTMTMDRTHLSAIVYDSTGKKLVEGNIPNEPYRREWKDFKAEGRSIMPKSGEDSTFSIFFMASNRLNEVQFVI